MTFSCDVNIANLKFLQTQGKIFVDSRGDFIFRRYNGTGENRSGWLFPPEQNIPLKPYLQTLLEIDPSPDFVLLTEEQKDALEKCLAADFPQLKIDFDSDEGDSDYIYSIKKMAELPGKDFQKKRNHVSKFLRTYNQDWSFTFFDGNKGQVPDLNQLQEIYMNWKNQCPDQNTDDFLLSEEKSLKVAINQQEFKSLGLLAGILSLQNKPSAFIIASFTAPVCLNAHFEKCTSDAAANGALAFLNQQFAKALQQNYPDCQYLNREEDLNIPGLRKSKLSYNPEFLLKKFFGKVRFNN